MSKRKTTEQFIAEARLIHGDKYDYSKVEYKTANDKVCIVCSVHGEFWQRPCDHTNGHGCKKCVADETSKRCRTKFNDFFKKATAIHNEKYEYDESSFSSVSSKVRIKCPNHGWFEQLAIDHTRGIGCPDCGYDSHKHQIYGIAAVYSTKEQAYEYVDCHGTDFRVEEHDIDTTVEKKERIWEVFINTETYSVLRCESGIYGPGMKDIIRLHEVYGKGSVPYMALYIQCDTVKRACKIASERLMQIKSNPVFYKRVFNKYPDKYGDLVFKRVVYGTGEFADSM